MNEVIEQNLCEILNQQADLLDATFYKEAVQSAMRYGVPDKRFTDFLKRYINGKYWIFVHQN